MFAPDLAQDAAAVGLADLDQRTERVERRRDIAGLLGDDDKMIVLLVFGERDPEAIENSPAHRRYQPQADAVLVRENRVTLRIHNLQLVHSPADGGEKQCLTAGEDRRAPGKQLLAKRIPPHCASVRTDQGALTAAQQKTGDRKNRDGQHRAENRRSKLQQFAGEQRVQCPREQHRPSRSAGRSRPR